MSARNTAGTLCVLCALQVRWTAFGWKAAFFFEPRMFRVSVCFAIQSTSSDVTTVSVRHLKVGYSQRPCQTWWINYEFLLPPHAFLIIDFLQIPSTVQTAEILQWAFHLSRESDKCLNNHVHLPCAENHHVFGEKVAVWNWRNVEEM